MKINSLNYRNSFPLHENDWNSVLILIGGLILTGLLTLVTYNFVERQNKEEFISVAKEIELRIESRLHAHALILRTGSAYFTVSDTVTRKQWKEFTEHSMIDRNLPGIEGFGFTKIVPPDQLEQHTLDIRNEGFPGYSVYPEGQREFYTSIIFLEPFSGRNLRAFGYDMFSHPIRRRAMEYSRDNDVAMLTGKVALVQETGENNQAGTLMYVPVYNSDMPSSTVEERRRAIKGWVYSPYRMNDLMQGILGRWDEIQQDRIHLQIYDDSIYSHSLLYDSHNGLVRNKPATRTIVTPLDFNGTQWKLLFKQSGQASFFNGNVIIVFSSGIIISILLFFLSRSFFKITYRSNQIKIQNDELQKLNATKDKFFSIIAHDLKSPFNAIVGFSDMLVKQVDRMDQEGIAKFAGIIHQSSQKAMDLLMNLMEWSQSQTGRMEFSPERFDLVSLIKEVELLFIDVAEQKAIEMKNDLPSDAFVYADEAMISTVIRNLISNAIKFTDPGGKIIISARQHPDELIVSVTDTGVGIPKNKIEKLFRIDENYSTSGTQNETGTGLGLILCQEFISQHQGKIWAESQVGNPSAGRTGGSTFYFSLPVKSENQGQNLN
jgi:signal transduction histidine kinase